MKSGSLCLIQAVASIVVLVIISMIVIVSIDLLPVFTTREMKILGAGDSDYSTNITIARTALNGVKFSTLDTCKIKNFIFSYEMNIHVLILDASDCNHVQMVHFLDEEEFNNAANNLSLDGSSDAVVSRCLFGNQYKMNLDLETVENCTTVGLCYVQYLYAAQGGPALWETLPIGVVAAALTVMLVILFVTLFAHKINAHCDKRRSKRAAQRRQNTIVAEHEANRQTIRSAILDGSITNCVTVTETPVQNLRERLVNTTTSK